MFQYNKSNILFKIQKNVLSFYFGHKKHKKNLINKNQLILSVLNVGNFRYQYCRISEQPKFIYFSFLYLFNGEFTNVYKGSIILFFSAKKLISTIKLN